MTSINQRPVCHRAEDLVTFLYGEAGEIHAKDFGEHLQQCAACQSEFAVFQQVHESIRAWRDESLGTSFSPVPVMTEPAVFATPPVQPGRRLSALAALREFFSVSPLWLRAVTGFAAVLLCVLGIATILNSRNQTAQVAQKESETKYSQADLDQAVQKRVDEISKQKVPEKPGETTSVKTADDNRPTRLRSVELAANPKQSKATHQRGLNRQEREQLAADLRLIPRAEDESLFILSDEPNQ
jgi:hypothetical protein